jgi:hypothetical protein
MIYLQPQARIRVTKNPELSDLFSKIHRGICRLSHFELAQK